MNTLGISEARSKLPQLIDQVDQELGSLFITKNGKPKAVLMSSEEFESWVETVASYQDPQTRKRNTELKSGKKQKFLTLKDLYFLWERCKET